MILDLITADIFHFFFIECLRKYVFQNELFLKIVPKAAFAVHF